MNNKSQMNNKLRKFIIGAIVTTLATTAGYLIGPIEVRFIQSLTTSPILMGLTFSIGAIIFALLSLWLGRLSDKHGRKNFIIIGSMLGIIYPLLYASTINVFQYMGVSLAWAFAGVATGPIITAYLQDLLKDNKKKGQYFGTMYSVQAIAGSGATLLGGVLADKIGLRAPYIAMAFFFSGSSNHCLNKDNA